MGTSRFDHGIPRAGGLDSGIFCRWRVRRNLDGEAGPGIRQEGSAFTEATVVKVLPGFACEKAMVFGKQMTMLDR